MNGWVSHDRAEETLEAKARWFQSLLEKDRFDLFCSWTELALSLNPDLIKGNSVKPIKGRIQVLTRA